MVLSRRSSLHASALLGTRQSWKAKVHLYFLISNKRLRLHHLVDHGLLHRLLASCRDLFLQPEDHRHRSRVLQILLAINGLGLRAGAVVQFVQGLLLTSVRVCQRRVRDLRLLVEPLRNLVEFLDLVLELLVRGLQAGYVLLRLLVTCLELVVLRPEHVLLLVGNRYLVLQVLRGQL